MYKSCADLWKFFHAFRSGGVDRNDFHHRQHLAVALCYASIMPFSQALDAFRSDLFALIGAWGHERKYHETITHFWLAVAAHYYASRGNDRCLAELANEFVRDFGDKSLIERHYSPVLLWSPAARAEWICPDREAIPV